MNSEGKRVGMNQWMRQGKTWTMSLAIICLGIIGYGYFYPREVATDFWFQVSSDITVAVLIAVPFHATVGRGKAWTMAVLALVAISACLIASSYIGYSQKQARAKALISEIQKNFTNVAKAGVDAQGNPRQSGEKLDVNPTVQGSYGEVERFVKTMMNRQSSLTADYLRELNAAGWESLLSPERLKKDPALTDSKAIIGKARDIVHKYREKSYAMLDETQGAIEKVAVNDEMKEQMTNGFRRGAQKSRTRLDLVWGMESQAIDEFDNIISFLAQKKGKWQIVDGGIVFSEQKDLDKLNVYLSALDNLENQQNDIRKKNVDGMNERLDKLKN